MNLEQFEQHDRMARVVLVAVVLMTAIITVTPWPVGSFQDDAIYTILAKSLASGKGYRLLNLPGEPNATHYPPGYPLVLAAIWKAWPSFPDNIVAFKFANAGFLSVAALGAYAFVRRRLAWSVPAALALGVAGTLSIVVLLVTGVVLSEPLFMALLFPVLLLAESSHETPGARRALGAGLAIGVLALVRTIGVALLPAALIALIWKRRVRDSALLLVGAMVLLLPWQLWVSAHASEVPDVLSGKYGAYFPWLIAGYRDGGLPFLQTVVTSNLQSLGAMFGFAFMPVVTAWPRLIAIGVICALALGGIAMLVRSSRVTALFLVVYFGITIAWPFEPARFLLAIWPLVVVIVVLPVARLWSLRPSPSPLRALRVGGLTVAAALAVGYLTYNGRGFKNQWWASVQRNAGERAKPIVEWSARNTAPTDVLATEDDLIVYLYAGRQALPTSTFLASERTRPLSDEEDIAAVRSILASYRPRFFITASRQGIRTASALEEAEPPELRRHSSLANTVVFERVSPLQSK